MRMTKGEYLVYIVPTGIMLAVYFRLHMLAGLYESLGWVVAVSIALAVYYGLGYWRRRMEDEARTGELLEEIEPAIKTIIDAAKLYRKAYWQRVYPALEGTEETIDRLEKTNAEVLDKLQNDEDYFESFMNGIRNRLPNKKRRGRKRGSLSSLSLEGGATVDEIMSFLIEAKKAHEADDGTFAALCRREDHPESTVRYWLTEYAKEIEAASNSK